MNAAATNRFAKPAAVAATPSPSASGGGGGAPSSNANGAGANGATPGSNMSQEARVPTWGDWREDGVEGRGIQIRDWVHVLERDGREKVALQRALNRLA